ncbi:MAG: TetR/AcrR family transcriptional regulator [Thiovulaceae bacterium]|nr:TetR/AcrR family transcriptional regulator [Sulfurimonadaceae bacterium]
MSRLNSKMKNIKHDLILDKASEMFEEQGFNELKISGLAHEVGVSVGTIYAYFDSKEGLFSACVAVQIEEAYELFVKLFKEDIEFGELLEKSVQIKFDAISKKRKTLETGAFSNPFFFESQQIAHKEGFDKIYKLHADLIDQYKEVDIDSMQLVYILNSIGNAYVLRWIEGELEELDTKAKEVSSLFMRILKGC